MAYRYSTSPNGGWSVVNDTNGAYIGPYPDKDAARTAAHDSRTLWTWDGPGSLERYKTMNEYLSAYGLDDEGEEKP